MKPRHKKKLIGLIDRLLEELKDGTEIFFEQRPHLWEGSGITKARENLSDAQKQNKKAVKKLCQEIEENELDEKAAIFTSPQ